MTSQEACGLSSIFRKRYIINFKFVFKMDSLFLAFHLCVIFCVQNTRFKANFGNRPFMYAEGGLHRSAADEAHDLTQEIRETFNALPFHMGSDSDSEGGASNGTVVSEGTGSSARSQPGPPCRTSSIPKSLRGKTCAWFLSKMNYTFNRIFIGEVIYTYQF